MHLLHLAFIRAPLFPVPQARDGGGLVPQPPWLWLLALWSGYQHTAGVYVCVAVTNLVMW